MHTSVQIFDNKSHCLFIFFFRISNVLLSKFSLTCLWKIPVTNLKNNLPKEVKKKVHAVWSMNNIYFSLPNTMNTRGF